MPLLSPLHRTALANTLALVAAALIVTYQPASANGAGASASAAQAATLPVVYKAAYRLLRYTEPVHSHAGRLQARWSWRYRAAHGALQRLALALREDL